MADLYKWRITNNLSTINKGRFVNYGIPTPSQCSFLDHAIKVAQGEGGIAKHGFQQLTVLWTKLSPNQAADLKDFIKAAHPTNGGNGLLYMTVKPLDGEGWGWYDVSGKPDLEPIAGDAPFVGADGYIHSNIILKLNNANIISTQPNFF